MKNKLEKFDGTKTYATPIGGIQTPEYLIQKFPALTLGITYVIHTDENGIVALSEPMNLSQLRTHYEIDSELSETQAIEAIETIMNTPPEPYIDTQGQALENIAAQLEFQNLMSLEDI